MVADVDCTEGGKSLCEKHNVQGYPTIKWGDPDDLKDYDGARDLSALQTFASENLGPTCGPDSLELCDEADKKFIAKFQKWDIDELDIAVEEKDAKVKTIRDRGGKIVSDLENQVKDLQGKIEQQNKKKTTNIDKEKKRSGYKYMKAVKASRMPDPDEDPDLAEDEKKSEAKEDL